MDLDDAPLPPLADEAAYLAAMAEIDALWESPRGTPAGDRLDKLVDVVVAYENIHYPMDDAPPSTDAAAGDVAF